MRSQIPTTYQCVQDQSMCFKKSFFFFKFYSIKLKSGLMCIIKCSCKCNFLRCGCSQLHKIVTIYNQHVYEFEYKLTFPCCFFIFYTQVPEKCEIQTPSTIISQMSQLSTYQCVNVQDPHMRYASISTWTRGPMCGTADSHTGNHSNGTALSTRAGCKNFEKSCH